VLVVEDDEDLREIYAYVLAAAGYAPALAGDGVQALAWLRRAARPPVAILLDLMMPVMDGWQFRAHQRRDPALAGIPVIVVSAASDPARLHELAPAAVVPKPFAMDDLLDVLRRVV
jgi:CheY-like chemotaxis protein